MRLTTYQPRFVQPDIPSLEKRDYEEGVGKFVTRFSERHSSEVTFYQFGQIRAPGISDIDLLLVVEDRDWQQARERAGSIANSSELLRQLFVHEPLVVGESLVPCLPVLHTLEHCRLALVAAAEPDEETRLMRHAVWNSFIRIAALELEGERIGLRRTLSLTHNLLTSAHQGNRFLSNPVPLPLSTEQIREEVLMAAPQDRRALVRAHLRGALEALDAVDGQMDRELEGPLGIPLRARPWAMMVRQRIVVTSDPSLLGRSRQLDRLFRNLRVVRVPAYLIALASTLAHYLGERAGQLAAFRAVRLPQEVWQRFEVAPYARCFEKALRAWEGLGGDPLFPIPFSHRESRLPLKRWVEYEIRRQVLLWRVGNLPSGAR
jgi:hypothetical protein